MKIEVQLWPLEGEQGFKEIWPSEPVFDSISPLFELDWDFVCVEVLQPSQPNGVMSSAVSLPNHMFIGQA